MTPELARVAEKIRKLLALAAGKGATPAEAAAAAATAAELMERYRLDQAMLDDQVDPEAVRQDGSPLVEMPKRRAWATLLVCKLAELNGCCVVSERYRDGPRRKGTPTRGSTSLRLVGRPDDMAIVRYLYAYAEREIERLCTGAIDRGMRRSLQNAYKLGAAEAVILHVEFRRREARRHAPSLAIVRVDQRLADANAAVAELATDHMRSRRVDGDAQQARQLGQKHGWGIALHDGLDGAPVAPGQITAAQPQGETDGIEAKSGTDD